MSSDKSDLAGNTGRLLILEDSSDESDEEVTGVDLREEEQKPFTQKGGIGPLDIIDDSFNDDDNDKQSIAEITRSAESSLTASLPSSSLSTQASSIDSSRSSGIQSDKPQVGELLHHDDDQTGTEQTTGIPSPDRSQENISENDPFRNILASPNLSSLPSMGSDSLPRTLGYDRIIARPKAPNRKSADGPLLRPRPEVTVPAQQTQAKSGNLTEEKQSKPPTPAPRRPTSSGSNTSSGLPSNASLEITTGKNDKKDTIQDGKGIQAEKGAASSISAKDPELLYHRERSSFERNNKIDDGNGSQTDKGEPVVSSTYDNKKPESLSVREKSSLFTTLMNTEKEKSDNSSPKPASRPIMRSETFHSSRSFAENASKRGVTSEIREKDATKPKPSNRRSTVFQAALEAAEGQKTDRTSLTESRVTGQTVKQSSKFKVLMDIAQGSNVQEEQQTGKGVRKREVNPSFRAARNLVSEISVKGLDQVHGKTSKTTRQVEEADGHDIADSGVDKKRTSQTEKTPKDKTILVAAIDFGTTYTAIAFSFESNPDRVFALTWEDGNVKTPTAILLDPDQNVISFGHQAKSDFQEKFDNQETYKQWFYFDEFKMKLYVTNQYLDENIELYDYSGKKMKAMDVFAKAIGYLKERLLSLIHDNRESRVINKDTDIHWVLTVPAIWPDLSKTFMRNAAEKAKISSDFLTLALEPEAASLYCRRRLGVDLRGRKYIVMDLGGGTADLVCHEIQHDDTIKECHVATGGDFGGKMVNDDFMDLLTRIYGGKVIKKLMESKKYLELVNAIEIKKRNLDFESSFITLRHSVEALHHAFESIYGESIASSMEQSPLKDKVWWKGNGMHIKPELVKAMFDKPLQQIIDTTASILKKVTDINHIIMVGGFSNSQYIVSGIKQAFPEEGFVRDVENPESAVIQGAVRFGHEWRAISSRRSRYTYGIARLMKFKPGDREDYKIFANGTYWCDNCFYKHIEIGEEMFCDEDSMVKAHDYYPPDKYATKYILEVFASTKQNPRYTTDDDCYSIGFVPVDIDPQGDVWSKVEVKLVYRGTELEVQAYDVKSNRTTTGRVSFWN